MKIQVVDINMEALGAQFANMDDSDQSLFFKGLVGELRCWDSIYHGQMQFHSVARLLTEEDKALLDQTVGCIWYKEDR